MKLIVGTVEVIGAGVLSILYPTPPAPSANDMDGNQ